MINKNSMNIAKFSFINAMKSKGFIIYNAILLLAILVITNFTTVKAIFNNYNIFKDTVYSIKVVDEEDYLYSKLEKQLNVENVEKIDKISEEEASKEENIERNEIIVKVLSKESGEKYLQIISREALDGEMYSLISSVMKSVRNDEIEAKYGISEIDIQQYNSEVYIERKILDTDSVINGDYYLIKTIMIMLIYTLIVFSTNAVASQIANEKTSKSAEYIFTSVSAKDYLNGKVIGANLKTVANIALIILYLILGVFINSVLNKVFGLEITSAATSASQTTGLVLGVDIKVVKYLLLSFIYILLTSTLLSYVQAGTTAKVKSINEMDNSQTMTLMIIIIAYAVSMATSEINNIFTKIIANIPIFSMFSMPSNYINGVASISEVGISLVILLLAIIVVMRIIGRNFKRDILDLGVRKEEKKDESLKIAEEQIKKVKETSFKQFITGVAISMLTLIFMQTVLGLLLNFLLPNISPNQNVIAVSIIFAVSFVLPILILKGYSDVSIKANNNKDKKSNIVSWVLMALPVMYMTTFFVQLLMDKMNINPTMLESALIFDKSIIGYILFFVEIAILPAILEELLFRKVMLDRAKKYGTIFAIVFTSIMFGFIHMNIPQALNAIFIGIVFSYITIKTGTILPAMILHFINNGTQALLMINETNIVATNIINYIYFGLIIIGTILLASKFLKSRKDFVIQNDNRFNINIKNILSNYYMIIFILFFVAISMM